MNRITPTIQVLLVLTLLGTSMRASASPLHDAARDGEIDRVKSLVSAGEEVDELDRYSGSPLQNAAVGGHVEVAEFLISVGADVGLHDHILGYAPLHSAALGGSTEIVRLFLANGADVDTRDNSGSTALHVAADAGHTEIVRMLVDSNADVNARNDKGDPPIHLAGFVGNFDIVALLAANGVVVPPIEPVSDLLSNADASKGEAIFSGTGRCIQCHDVERGGRNRFGPNLWGVLEREKAKQDGYKYSAAFARLTGSWTYEEVNALLASAKDFVPGTKMEGSPGMGIKDVVQRSHVIAYLRQYGDDPPPLPTP